MTTREEQKAAREGELLEFMKGFPYGRVVSTFEMAEGLKWPSPLVSKVGNDLVAVGRLSKPTRGKFMLEATEPPTEEQRRQLIYEFVLQADALWDSLETKVEAREAIRLNQKGFKFLHRDDYEARAFQIIQAAFGKGAVR